MDTSLAPAAEPTSLSRGDFAAPPAANTPTSSGLGFEAPATRRHACRVCGSDKLAPYLNLGMQPLANALRLLTDTRDDERIPLTVRACPVCKLSQLSHVANPNLLYSDDYVFYAGQSKAWRTHCARLADSIPASGKFVVDVASNDGTLVREFVARGARALGVDPAANFNDGSYPARRAFWNAALSRDPEFAGKVDILCATNVLGHVDDVHDFVAGIATALAPAGTAIIEVPYVVDMLDTLTFDLVYHEHLSYWSVTALAHLAKAHGLTIRDITRINTHGGSLRVVLARGGTTSAAATKLLVGEHHDLRRSTYLRFTERVSARMAQLNVWAKALTPYVGYGASAKATVLLNTLSVEAYPTFIVDDNPRKQGRRVPGTRVPILAPPAWADEPGPVVIFSWNQADALGRQLRREGYRGDIYAPFPVPYTLGL